MTASSWAAMSTVNVHEAKTHLSRLLARVEAGERIVIARAGKPVAILGPVEERAPDRVPGYDRGRVTIHPTFDDPIPDLEEWF